MNIDGKTLILFFSSTPFNPGPQKPGILTASKIKYEKLKNGYFGGLIFQELEFFEHLKFQDSRFTIFEKIKSILK